MIGTYMERVKTRYEDEVSASTHNQALSAIILLYKRVLEHPLERMNRHSVVSIASYQSPLSPSSSWARTTDRSRSTAVGQPHQ